MRRRVLCLMWLAFPAFAAAEGPMLVLDAGGHTAPVSQVLFSRDGGGLISVSWDKTIRFWDAATGEPLRTLRPPVGAGAWGELYAADLAPDGKTLAVAGVGLGAGRGWIHLIALPGGDVRRVLKGHPSGVGALAFSPDGRRLASASNDKTVRVWEVDSGENTLTLQGHTEGVSGVAWSPDGRRLATASRDHTGRVWSAETGKEEAVLGGPDKATSCVAWSPDGKTVATGSWDGTVRLWGADGAARRTIDKLGIEVLSVHFSPDSRRLLYNGFGPADRRAGVLDLGGDGRTAFGKHINTVYCGAVSPDGALAATGDAAGRIFLWKTGDGAVARELGGRGLQVRGAAWAEGAGEQTLFWGNSYKGDSFKAETPLDHAFVLPELRPEAAAGRPVRRAAPTAGGLSVQVGDDFNSFTVRRDEEQVGQWRRNGNQFIRCYTFLGGDRLAVGMGFAFYLFDAHTLKPLRTFVGHTGTVWAVAPSPDGRYLLSASADQTLRIWTLDRDEPLLSFFFAGDDWVAWTPEGYYAASPGGEQLMGWQVNNGPDKMASYYPASQFRKTLYRPDVIKRLLTAGSLENALAEADKERGKAGRRTEVAQALPPKATITSPKAGGLRVDKAALHVEATAAGGDANPVSSLRLLLDGRPFGADAPQLTPGPQARAAWDVDLPPGSHRLSVRAVGAVSVGVSDELEATYTPAAAAPDKAGAGAGNLYVLAVGINDYPGALKLQCAAPDARLISQTFKDRGKGLFRAVEVRLLTDKEATRDGILKGLQWLRESARPGDVAVAFYAGHGDCRIAGRFFLIPVDADLKDLPATCVSGDELKAGLADLPCSTVLLLDACYSGSIDARRKKRALPGAADALVRDFAYDAGLVVMCGASKEQEAAEESGHGFFTKAIAEGLSGKAGKDKQGLVTLYKLQDYVHDRVAELSGGEQEPTVSIPSTVRSFPLAKP